MPPLRSIPGGEEPRNTGLNAALAGVILVVVIAWALAAVVMLTGTLTNARQIEHRVKLVNAQVDPIKKHTAFIALAHKTLGLTAQIKSAAAPLSGELAQVLASAGQINLRVGTILSTARSINGVVTSINSAAHSIGSSVGAIGASVSSISSSVSSIAGSVNSIHSRVSSVLASVGTGARGSISGDVNGIDARLSRVLSEAHSIRSGVIGINNRASTSIGAVGLIKGDFDAILSVVGTVLGTPTILGHANSIDCSPLLVKTQDCNK
jgi:phage-related protein